MYIRNSIAPILNRTVLVLGLLTATLTGCIAGSANNDLPDQAAADSATPALPEVELADLDGQVYNFPKDLPADLNLFIFGFAHEQKEATQTWVEPVLEIQKTQPKLSLFKVPVIDSSAAVLRLMIRNGMRSKSDDAARKRTLTLFVDKAKFSQRIGVTDDKQPSIVLFDRSGKIVWRSEGASTPEKLASLNSFLAQSSQK